MCRRHTLFHGHQRFRAGTDDGECRTAVAVRDVDQIHIRARIGGSQHPVEVQRRTVVVHFEALRQHHLEGLARLDLLDQTAHACAEFFGGAAAQVLRLGLSENRHRGLSGRGQCGSHPVQPSDRIVIGLVDPFGGAVPVNGIGDERDRTLVVVEGREIGSEHQHHLGQPQIVDGEGGQPLDPAHRVIAEVADHAARQRGQAGQPLGPQ